MMVYMYTKIYNIFKKDTPALLLGLPKLAVLRKQWYLELYYLYFPLALELFYSIYYSTFC